MENQRSPHSLVSLDSSAPASSCVENHKARGVINLSLAGSRRFSVFAHLRLYYSLSLSF